MGRVTFYLALVLCLLTAHAPASGATLSDAEQRLLGRWAFTHPGGNKALNRIFEVHSIASDGAAFKGEGYYGGDSINEPVSLAISPDGDEFAIRFSTRRSDFEVKTVGADRLRARVAIRGANTSELTFRATPVAGAIFAPDAVPSLEDIERAVYGSWLIHVGNNPRPLSFDIREIVADGGAFQGKALYGWADGMPRPTPVKIALKNGIVGVDFMSITKTRIQARLVAADRMEGVVAQVDGRSFWATFRSSNEVNDVEAPGAPDGAKGPSRTFNVIYIGAANCPSCVAFYSRPESRGPRYSMRALKAFAESKGVRFYHLEFGTYSNTMETSIWPPEIRWVRDKTFVGGGTPRFLLVGEDKVYINVQGTALVPNIVQGVEKIEKARQAAMSRKR